LVSVSGKVMKSFFRISVVFAIAPLGFAGPRLAKDLPPSSANGTVDIIVQFKTPPSKSDLQQLGAYGQVKRSFTSINAVSVTVTADALATLDTNPNVQSVSPNRPQKGFLDLSTA